MAFNLGSLLLNAGEIAGNAINYQKAYARQDADTANVQAETALRRDQHNMYQQQLAQMAQERESQQAMAEASSAFFKKNAGVAQGFDQQKGLVNAQLTAALSTGNYRMAQTLMELSDRITKDSDTHNTAVAAETSRKNETLASFIEGARATGDLNSPESQRKIFELAAGAGKAFDPAKIKTAADWERVTTQLETGTKAQIDQATLRATIDRDKRQAEATTARIKTEQENTNILRQSAALHREQFEFKKQLGAAKLTSVNKTLDNSVAGAANDGNSVMSLLKTLSAFPAGTTAGPFANVDNSTLTGALTKVAANFFTSDKSIKFGATSQLLAKDIVQMLSTTPGASKAGSSNKAMINSLQTALTPMPGIGVDPAVYQISMAARIVKNYIGALPPSSDPKIRKIVENILEEAKKYPDVETLIGASDHTGSYRDRMNDLDSMVRTSVKDYHEAESGMKSKALNSIDSADRSDPVNANELQ